MSYAVIRMGGKQLIVSKGDTFEIERQKIPLNIDVLLYSNDGKTLVGTPTLSEVKVDAKVIKETRADKIRVARFKAKSRYDKVNGHRQPISVIQIENIVEKEVKKAAVFKPTTTKASVKKSQPKKAKGVKKAK